MTKRILSMLLCLMLCVAPLAAQGEGAANRVAAAARTELWKAISGGAGSATVAVMDDGEIVYAQTFGMRDRARSIPVDAHTQFNIASISKVFTAAAILMLCDEGKVALDRPVTAYLPEFTMADERYADITVRMLLNHASGLPGSIMKDALGSVKYDGYIGRTLEVLADSGLKHAPGELSVYCNDALTLAEAIIERVSGVSYGEFLYARIFQKAGMADTSCNFRENNENIALHYDRQSGAALPAEYVHARGSGGLSSTAEDLCRFARAIFEGGLLSEAALAEFQAPQFAPGTVPEGPAFYQFGLGWDFVSLERFEDQGIRVFAKNGGSAQFSSQLYVAPKQRLAVALSVTGSADVMGICDVILQALLEEKGLVKSDPHRAALPPASAPIPAGVLGFEGYYGTNNSVAQVAFDRDANTLLYSVFDGEDFVLRAIYPYRADGFFHSDGGRLTFAESDDVKYLMAYPRGGRRGMVIAQALPPGTPTTETAFEARKWIAWVPANLSATEFEGFMAATGLIPGLPGYIYYRNNEALNGDTAYVPCAISGPRTTRMCLRNAADLAEPRIVEENGKLMLKVNGFLFTDANDVVDLAEGERVSIPESGRNAARRIAKDAVLTCDIPEGGRLLIFAPDLLPAYDSLMRGPAEMVVHAGAYVVFIGAAGDGFEPKLSEAGR
ncbi:MAG: serine hydrolase domain-containing protein [Eubacteriales bacterium]|nr:serine hydrolase domain-containing protein [Christensenellaceae bacterium]MEA5067326.1 serine hydrolase domain-containing protein [Eubacteriales bacterium]